MNIPTDRKYTASDEWVKVEGSVATIGITDYAQDQLSDVVFVEIAVSVGDSVKKNDATGSIESVKAAADVNMPVTGKVVEINEALPSSPELVNSDPFGAAWMVKVELEKLEEVEKLMDAEAYRKHCEGRGH